jgi:hypothetical protein
MEGNGSVHILSYEGLHRDTLGEVRAVLEFMDIPVDGELLGKAAELSSFTAMQEAEKKTKIPGINFNFASDDAESARVRKGKIGG